MITVADHPPFRHPPADLDFYFVRIHPRHYRDGNPFASQSVRDKINNKEVHTCVRARGVCMVGINSRPSETFA